MSTAAVAAAVAAAVNIYMSIGRRVCKCLAAMVGEK